MWCWFDDDCIDWGIYDMEIMNSTSTCIESNAQRVWDLNLGICAYYNGWISYGDFAFKGKEIDCNINSKIIQILLIISIASSAMSFANSLW